MVEFQGKPALLIVDMQNGFCHEQGFMGELGLDHHSSAAVIAPIGRLLAAARDAFIPVARRGRRPPSAPAGSSSR